MQLLERLRGAPLEVRPFTALDASARTARCCGTRCPGAAERVAADTVIVVGERVARDWSALVPDAGTVRVIGDALVPRKASHAIAEGRAAAEAIAPGEPAAPAWWRRRRTRPDQAIRTSVLPIVSPASIRASASGARSRPSTIVSR